MPGKSSAFYRITPWQALRTQVLRRDAYTCQACKRNGKPFVVARIVHHIKDRHTYPELAMAEENLESLCRACHNKLHPEKSFKRAALCASQHRARVIRM